MLWGAWTKNATTQAASSTPPTAQAPPEPVRTSTTATRSTGNIVEIQCLAVQCPVFVAGPGPTDVQFNGKLSHDERRIFRETRLTVAVDDASTVSVTINGRLQPKGRPGQAHTFAVPTRR